MTSAVDFISAHAYPEQDLPTLPDSGGQTWHPVPLGKAPDDRFEFLGRP